MKMGVLGSGMVAQAISARLAELGHDVMIRTRDAEKLKGWQSSKFSIWGIFPLRAARKPICYSGCDSLGR